MKNQITIDGREYVSMRFLLDRIGISAPTFYRWKHRGLIPVPLKLGKWRFYNLIDVELRLSEGE